MVQTATTVDTERWFSFYTIMEKVKSLNAVYPGHTVLGLTMRSDSRISANSWETADELVSH